MERQLTFIDVDENRLELWLKPDRVQLVVIDSRPELEAGELRRFASVLFAEYVARDLADRLAAARRQLEDARDRARGGAPAAGVSSGGSSIWGIWGIWGVWGVWGVWGSPADPAGPADPADPADRVALGGELVAALDGALRAIDALAAAVTIPEPLPVPVEIDPEALDGEPAPVWGAGPAEPAAPAPIVFRPSAENRRYPPLQASLQASRQASRQASLKATRRASRKRSRGGDRAEEASAIRWGGATVAVQ